MAEGRQPRRVGEIGACGEALSKYERNQEQFDGNAYVMPCARCTPSPSLQTPLCPALDWTHVGQSGLPLAVKLFNWSLIGCDCSALGGTARCRACFLTLQAKVMIPTAAPVSALPLFAFCRAVAFHFLFCTISEMNFGISLPSRAQSTCLPLNLSDQRALSFLPGRTPSFPFPFPFPLPLPLLSWCCAALIAH